MKISTIALTTYCAAALELKSLIQQSNCGQNVRLGEPPHTSAFCADGYTRVNESSRDSNGKINGTGKKDYITGGNLDDRISGRQGDDQIDGGLGDDVIRGKEGNDVIFGGEGNDTIQGDEGDDKLYGGPGNDVLDGNAGSDELYG